MIKRSRKSAQRNTTFKTAYTRQQSSNAYVRSATSSLKPPTIIISSTDEGSQDDLGSSYEDSGSQRDSSNGDYYYGGYLISDDDASSTARSLSEDDIALHYGDGDRYVYGGHYRGYPSAREHSRPRIIHQHESPYMPRELRRERPGKTHPVWAEYIQEAAIEDKETVEAWKNDLDTLLVFAGLFSAVLTAFLIESYQDLRPDTSERILDAVTRGFRSLSDPASSSTPPNDWNATSRGVRVNSFWFASLACSLMAAAGAMLAKSWCQEYLRRSTVGSPYDQAQRRQRRFDSLRQWWFHEVVNCIPLLLYTAILLFGIGLCDFLFELQRSIAFIVLGIFSFGLSFAIITTTSSILAPDCPYRTPLTSNLARSYRALLLPFRNLGSLLRSRWCRIKEHGQIVWNESQLTGFRHISPKKYATIALYFTYKVCTMPWMFLQSQYHRFWSWVKHSRKPAADLVVFGHGKKRRRWNQDVAAWGWLIKSSADETLIAELLQSIPTLALNDDERESLKESGAIDRLVAFFVTTFDSDPSLSQPQPVIIQPYITHRHPSFNSPQNFVAQNKALALLEFAQALRVLYGPPTGRRDKALDPVSRELIRPLQTLRTQRDLGQRILPECFCILDGFGVLGDLKWDTIEEAANTRIPDWSCLLLIETISDAVRVKNRGRSDIALLDQKVVGLVAKLMKNVTRTSQNALIFLRSLFILLSDNQLTEPIDPTISIHRMMFECISILSDATPSLPSVPRHYVISEEEYGFAWEELVRIVTWYFENRTDTPSPNQTQQAIGFFSASVTASLLNWNTRVQAAKTLWQLISKDEDKASRKSWTDTILRVCAKSITEPAILKEVDSVNSVILMTEVLYDCSPPEKWHCLLGGEEEIAPALVRCIGADIKDNERLLDATWRLLRHLQVGKVANPWLDPNPEAKRERPYQELEAGMEMLLRWDLGKVLQEVLAKESSARPREISRAMKFLLTITTFPSFTPWLIKNESLLEEIASYRTRQRRYEGVSSLLASLRFQLWFRASELPVEEAKEFQTMVERLVASFPPWAAHAVASKRQLDLETIYSIHLALPFLKHIAAEYPKRLRASQLISRMASKLKKSRVKNSLQYWTGTYGETNEQHFIQFSLSGLLEELDVLSNLTRPQNIILTEVTESPKSISSSSLR